MRKLLLVISILATGACATEQKYQMYLNNWLQQPESILIEQWGVPTGVYELDNQKFLTYDKSDIHTTPGYYDNFTGRYSTATINTYSCKTTFTIENKTIINYSYNGNSCVAY